jgi:hypothetical protein
MRRVTGLVLTGLLLIVATWWWSPERAYACSCVNRTDTQLAEDADVIFTGRIAEDRIRGQSRTITFAVDRVYKGDAHTQQAVHTHASGASCGLEISGPGPFVVFANRDDTRAPDLQANLCGGTREGAPPAHLGEGYAPLTGGGTSPAWIAVPVVALVAAFGFAALAWRRRLRDAPD